MKKELLVLGLGTVALLLIGVVSGVLNQSANQFAVADPKINLKSVRSVDQNLSPAPSPQLRYQIVDLGTFPQFWPTQSIEPKSINNVGEVVGIVKPWSIEGNARPFKWENGTLSLLSIPSQFDPIWYSVFVEDNNNSDQSVGWALPYPYNPSASYPGFFWSDENPEVFEDVWWNGLDDNTRFLVGTRSGHQGLSQGVIYDLDNSTFTDIGFLENGYYSVGKEVNTSGQVACTSYDAISGLPKACLWSNGVLTDIGTLGGSVAESQDINNFGHIVGWSTNTDGLERAFLWRNGVMENLGSISPDSYQSHAYGINDRDEVVGSSEGTAWLWRNGTLFNLSLFIPPNSEWLWLNSAQAINNRGQIIGRGILASGQQRAFLMTPITP